MAKSAVPSSRKINGKALSGDVSLNAGDVGAVSATGGNYQGTFNFSEIATIAKERNSVQLISTNAGAPAGTLCSYMKANWYGNEIAVGAVRGGTVDLIGAGIDINSKRALTIYKNGIVVPADYGNFDARYDNIPVGVPLPYPHRYTPVGYLTCNGQSFDKSLYPKLAEAYPNGRVPDLRGEFIRGWDDSRGVDPGRVCGTWQPDAMQGHTHRAWPNATAASATDSPSQHGGPEYTGRITQTHVVSSPVSDGVNGEPRTANETRPRNIAFNYIVRAA
ncbi:phage tail protein [Photorhabdus bodei]|nr:phage tail protein [Photorhabdus bodei]